MKFPFMWKILCISALSHCFTPSFAQSNNPTPSETGNFDVAHEKLTVVDNFYKPVQLKIHNGRYIFLIMGKLIL